MSLSYISREDLQKSIEQLEQALYNHQVWYNGLTRTMICRLPGDEHDLAKNAYEHCRFGQWYYGENIPQKLKEHQGFIAIGDEHRHMHQMCTQLLIENESNSIKTIDYDKFANALERMRLEIYALKRELDETLYNHDPLTGAVTRVSMLPILREHQELLKRENQSCVIAMMDIDHFKRINDQYGHSAGDLVLVELINFSMKKIRPYDKIFRYGGEEFLFLMQNTDMTVAFDIITRLCNEIAKLSIDIGTQHFVSTSVSFGVTTLDPNIPVEESIDRADKALYEAKAAGRNCVMVWTP
jgi:diguanylate cyclase (GGDEF)-like protein